MCVPPQRGGSAIDLSLGGIVNLGGERFLAGIRQAIRDDFFFPKLRCQIRLRPSPFPPLLVAYTFHLLVREARPTPITQAEIRSTSQKRNEPTGLRT